MTHREQFQAGNPAQVQGGLNPEESFAELDQATDQRLGREAQSQGGGQGLVQGVGYQAGHAGSRDYGMALDDEAVALSAGLAGLGGAATVPAGLADEGAAARTERGAPGREGQAPR